MAAIEKRISKNSQNITYRVKVRLKGFPTQSATFTRLTDAKRWAQHTESAIREGRYFKTNEARRRTLSDCIDRYLLMVMPHKPKAERMQRPQLLCWKEAIGERLLHQVTPALISEHRDQLLLSNTQIARARSPATVNRYLAALSHVFTIAVREWNWIDENPVLNVNRLTEPRGRIRFLDDDERSRLLSACKSSASEYLYTVVILALSTGARRMEILGLHWSDIDFQREVITLHDTKNGERRVLPLVGHAKTILLAYAKVRYFNTDLIFPSKDKKRPIDLRTPWKTALRKASIDNFRFHDLRHSAASYLAMNGATLAEIAEVMGHKTLQMVKRYAHLSEAHTAKVVASMNKKIFS